MPRSNLFLVVLVCAASSCSDQTAPREPARAALLQAVTPAQDTSHIDARYQLVVRALDATGNPVARVPLVWSVGLEGDSIHSAELSTDEAGYGRATLHIGTRSGPRLARVASSGLQSQTFLISVPPADLARLDITPTSLDLISRQRRQVTAQPLDAFGNIASTDLRWKSMNETVATVDSTGLLRARRPGTTTIYVNATTPPFLVDSVMVAVRAATPSRIDLRPDTAGFVAGHSLRLVAVAYDSAGKAIDADDVVWTTSNPAVALSRATIAADSSIVSTSATQVATSTIEARIGNVRAMASISSVTDPLLERIGVRGSFCYGGVTFGPSGQWYYVSNVFGSSQPKDTIAVVRTGTGRPSTWTSSEEFAECDRTYSSSYPQATISVDSLENLYVPTKHGVLSIAGLTGATRWHARIGQVKGAMSVSNAGLLFAGPEDEIIALDTSTGAVVWRQTMSTSNQTVATAVDDARGVVYASTWNLLTAFDRATGGRLWATAIPEGTSASLAIGPDATIYLSAIGVLYAIRPDGRVRATATMQTNIGNGAPVIDAQGNVYLATGGDRTVYSFSADLTPRWRFSFPSNGGSFAMSTAVIDAAGVVYVGNGPDLVAIRDGKVLWTRPEASGYFGGNNLIGPDGAIYAMDVSRIFRARSAGIDPRAPWPMVHATPTRTQRF